VTYDTFKVMQHILSRISRRDVLIEASAPFDDDIWVGRNMFSLNGVQKYLASWEQFCEAVKHEAKHRPGPDRDDEDTTRSLIGPGRSTG
jgi:hypothetical protein